MTAPDEVMGAEGATSVLTEAQLDGLACIGCDGRAGSMVPVGLGPRGQLFACDPCCADRIPETLPAYGHEDSPRTASTSSRPREVGHGA